MVSIGLVLSAGGMHATAYHCGILSAIAEVTGWDPRTARLIVGTSAGSSMAVTIRAGLSIDDHAAHHMGNALSVEGRALVEQIKTPMDLPTKPPEAKYGRPTNPLLLIHGLLGGQRLRPVLAFTGILPEGTVNGDFFRDRINEIHIGSWPDLPTWVCAVDLGSGKRAVFGRDPIEIDVGTAVQASCAIPGFLRPVEWLGRRYVDGGIHSTTNADLLSTLNLDLIIVSSSMTAIRGLDTWPTGPLSRAWHSRTLVHEIASIRSSGTTVLVAEPTAEDLLVRNTNDLDDLDNSSIFESARTSALARLAHPKNIKARNLLTAAATNNNR